eukprot:CAMPEP_0180701694 /NCGR_PEP_ID=MMETSP1038_2-20121128/5736_1 /TAXON_ID=632150 /ORGANISM="Azadinium spinosum, Strain 3D9" /LENGTH=123 /DNA_ID=CAMNT_0022733431 /DNA_START=97 /DNA_END=464 /DNA_ORIENTATION=+
MALDLDYFDRQIGRGPASLRVQRELRVEVSLIPHLILPICLDLLGSISAMVVLAQLSIGEPIPHLCAPSLLIPDRCPGLGEAKRWPRISINGGPLAVARKGVHCRALRGVPPRPKILAGERPS